MNRGSRSETLREQAEAFLSRCSWSPTLRAISLLHWLSVRTTDQEAAKILTRAAEHQSAAYDKETL